MNEFVMWLCAFSSALAIVIWSDSFLTDCDIKLLLLGLGRLEIAE